MTLTYDGAPRPITELEAVAIAESEFDYRQSNAGGSGWIIVSRGADGGMHYRDNAYSEASARGSVAERRRKLVRRIMAGECTHTVFYDRARDRFYSA